MKIRPTGKYVCSRSGEFAECCGCRHAVPHEPNQLFSDDSLTSRLDDLCNAHLRDGAFIACEEMYKAFGIKIPIVCISVVEQVEEVADCVGVSHERD